MSSAPGPSRKRTRTEDGGGDATRNPPISSIQRDEDVWLSDGNIVIVAADTMAFRVHKSILSLRSEVFRDLFLLPNADAATMETMDGCPVVRVSDSPDDIRRLFLVLCCGKNYYYDGDALVAVPFEVLASLIRMGHKYALQDILDHALSRLKKYYTNDLSAWKDPESRARYVTATDDDAPTVVTLGRLTNTPSLLPTALLVCTEIAADYWEESDGSIVSRIASLPVSDQLQLTAAKASLAEACATRPLRLLASVPCPGCMRSAFCRAAREAPLDALRDRDVLPSFSDHNALKPVAETFWGDVHWRRLCANCREVLLEIDEIEIKVLWGSLPDIFALGLDKDTWQSGSAGTGQ
ncbi:hypothetical protein LXA43DRAFT_1028014 [Ganoderma leucocontextum]|nr:hypothetical protein LXA43DRAFT_1028014 [Ganoderma leucocontextum]